MLFNIFSFPISLYHTRQLIRYLFLLFFVKNVWSNLNQFWGLETFLSAHAAVSSTGFSSPSISGNWKSGLWPLRYLFVSSWLRILKSKKEQENKLVGSPFFPSLLSHGFREKASLNHTNYWGAVYIQLIENYSSCSTIQVGVAFNDLPSSLAFQI